MNIPTSSDQPLLQKADGISGAIRTHITAMFGRDVFVRLLDQHRDVKGARSALAAAS